MGSRIFALKLLTCLLSLLSTCPLRPSKKSADSSELIYSTDPEEVKLKLAERRELRSKRSRTPEDEKRLTEVTAWLCARTVPV
jgi:hypothetical protein